ncbi:MAG: N-acetylmuramoyl-L-alanine amidase [Bacillota bacterium]
MPKKIGLLTLLIILLFNLSAVAQGNNIKLKINDSVVTDDLEYKLAEDDILVPLNVLTDNLAIKMKWHSSIETLRLEYKDKSLKFRLGGKRLQVNNELVKFSVAPYKSEDKFMVPLKVLGEALGLVIRSEPDQGIVNIYQDHARLTNIANLKQGSADGIKVSLDQQVTNNSMVLQDPSRIVFDLKGTALYKKISDFKVDSPLIEQVRIAQFDGNTVRLVLDLKTKSKHKIEKKATSNGCDYLLKLTPLITGVSITDNQVQLDSTASLSKNDINYLEDPNRVIVDIEDAILEDEEQLEAQGSIFKGVEISQHKKDPYVVRLVIDLDKQVQFKTESDEKGLVIEPIENTLQKVEYQKDNKVKLNLNQKVEPETMFLESDSRLLLDFPSTVTELKSKEFEYNSDLIEEVRVSQYDQTTTRVVIDLIAPIPHQLEWNDNQLEVSLFNKLTDINIEKTELGLRANLNLLAPENYKVTRLVDPRRLVIDIPNLVANKEEIEVPEGQGAIEEIRVSQYSGEKHQVRVVLELNQSIDLSKDVVGNSLQFNLTNFNLEGKVITIDPGHGGQDPGAIGFSDLREKNPVLEIGLRLEELLEDTGAEVIMTRREDEFVSLEERVAIANKADSDIFVSIHLNGHRSSNSFGTETFIDPDSGENSTLLAQFIQNNLVDKLGTFDRGVKQEELYVLNHTNMPAVLEEVVFISNKEEEDKIMEDDFKEKSAVAIYKGIVKHFELLLEEE